MRKTNKIKKLTLVVSLKFLTIFFVSFVFLNQTFSNPHLDTPITSQKEDSNSTVINPDRLQNTSITVPESTSPKKKKVLIEDYSNKEKLFYSYRQSLAVFTGAAIEVNDSRDGDEFDDPAGLVLGISYLLPSPYSPNWEVEAIFVYFKEGHLSLMKRFTNNEKEAFRWFNRYGVILKIEADEKLSSVANWENVLIRGGIGMESMKKPPGSHRYSFDVAIGSELTYLLLTYGYSWGW